MVEQYSITLEQGIKGAKKRQKKQSSGSNTSWYYLGVAGQIGYSIAIPLVVGALVGSFIDKEMGIYPKGTLSGLGIGFVVSAIGFVHLVQELLAGIKKK